MLAQREVDQRLGVARRHAADLVCEQLRRDVLEADDHVLRGPAPALGRGHDRVGMRRGDAGLLVQRREEPRRRHLRRVAGSPAAGRRERDDRLRPAACGELQRDVAAERVARDVSGREACGVHRALDRVGQRVHRDGPVERWAAGVPGHGGSEHVVLALEHRQHELPGPPRVGEPVQADERRPGAAAMERREA
jgi:hypothetical protein